MADFSFSRKWLDEILTDENLSEKEKAQKIMNGHITITNGLMDERDTLKSQAEANGNKAADLQKQLDGIKGGEDYKQKYEDEHRAFEDFRKQTALDAETARVKAAYRKLLVDEGISEKWLDRVMKSTDLSGVKLDESGSLANIDELKKAISDDWGDVKTTVIEKGAHVDNPPKQDNKAFETMSLAEKMAYANQNPTDPAVSAWLKK